MEKGWFWRQLEQAERQMEAWQDCQQSSTSTVRDEAADDTKAIRSEPREGSYPQNFDSSPDGIRRISAAAESG